MRFSKNRDFYQASRITGPAHNLLRLQLEIGQEPAMIPVEALPSSSPQRETGLLPDDLRRQVMRGVAEANEEFATAYNVTKIFFVADDTPSTDVYRDLARNIVSRIVKNEEFQTLS